MRNLLSTFALLALAAHTEVTRAYTHGPADLPPGWKHVKAALPSESLDVSIELRQPRLSALKARLADISDASHVDYGRHLTKDEVDEYQAPDQLASHLVMSWLKDEGIHNARLEGPSIRFRSSVEKLGRLLEADVGHYSYDTSTYLRSRSYSVPQHLSSHIRFVHPLSHFAKPVGSGLAATRSPSNAVAHGDLSRRKEAYISYKLPPHRAIDDKSQPCPNGANPDCLRTLFGLPPSNNTYAYLGSPSSRFAVAGFLEQSAHFDDVSSFLQKFAPRIHSTGFNFTVKLLNGASNPQYPKEAAGIEAALDLEYAMALGYPSDIKYYLSGGRGTEIADNGTALSWGTSRNEPFLDLLQHILSLSDDEIPHVLSISYSDDENSVPHAYATKVCDMFAQVAARGVSVIVSSGDGGAAGTSAGECYSNDGKYTKMFIPTFPPSCPYVTAVGATRSTVPLEGSMASGGGFSNYFETPLWQQQASMEYLKALGGKYQYLYNASGRATPDLSAPGEGFSIVVGGEEMDVSGTSASAPTIAAMISLVNGERLKAGKSSLGWLNPLLYTPQVREALVDVAIGSSVGCTYGNSTVPGFDAYPGYDCVTGLGSVGTFEKLLEVLG